MVIQRSDYSSQSIALINHWRVNEPAGPMRCLKLHKGKQIVMRQCKRTFGEQVCLRTLRALLCLRHEFELRRIFPFQCKATKMSFWHCRRYQGLWVFTQGPDLYPHPVVTSPSPEKPVPFWLPLSDWIWSIFLFFFFSNSTSESFAIQWRQNPLCLPRHL